MKIERFFMKPITASEIQRTLDAIAGFNLEDLYDDEGTATDENHEY
jgi:hypothetical protein